MVSGFGAEAVAVQRVGGQIESVSWNTADGFGTALNAFIGQNYGAGKMDRVKKGYKASLCSVGIWGIFITIIFVFQPKAIAEIFFHEPKATRNVAMSGEKKAKGWRFYGLVGFGAIALLSAGVWALQYAAVGQKKRLSPLVVHNNLQIRSQ